MARFVEAESPSIAMSIRANWWPSLGPDFGPPRKLDWAEVTHGEFDTPEFRAKTAEELSPTQEALPVALGFLETQVVASPDKKATDAPSLPHVEVQLEDLNLYVFGRNGETEAYVKLEDVRKLFAAAIPSPQTWQPIETLPEKSADGQGFLVYWPKAITGKIGEIDRLGGRQEYDDILSCGEPPATHWMPLPDPPKPAV